MKISRIVAILALVGILGLGLWLLMAADPKNLTRQDVVVDLDDNFKK